MTTLCRPYFKHNPGTVTLVVVKQNVVLQVSWRHRKSYLIAELLNLGCIWNRLSREGRQVQNSGICIIKLFTAVINSVVR
jgi:hypothetical protein